LSKRFRQHRTQGPAFQNGGVLVVKPGGECAYAFVSEVSGDMPSLSKVLGIARAARV
jgi:hypothetical protein